ncbi:neutral zinc metallopeptidase [Altererythrobacter aurantiacus]|uniref:Neutral zinc metallopeptidase n=1 Tax=Parapontixanthobacter aurantiacus TaxID=1463599 RepID=A0A844ZDN3_9SPHN|nr:metallopeptidase family protein [Parapontixanthobacter aurantiacus]MXO85985.1 neutral zinc metallopeptidase [Parapontixanthobacter aurantiacus]
MKRRIGIAPTAAEMETLALEALGNLPEEMKAMLRGVIVQVQDFADEETLAAVDLDEPFELTGIYEGRPLTEKTIEASGELPDRIRLFRRPILDEWAARGDETLEHLVAHVLIHEVGHHFGLSDDDMHALEDAAG